MKKFFLFLSLIIFFSLNSCKEKKGNMEVAPDDSEPRVYTPSLVNDGSDLGVTFYDDKSGESVKFFGKKDQGGVLHKLERFTFSYDSYKTVLEFRLSEDQTIREIASTYEGSKKIIKLSNYDFEKNTVDIEVVDGVNKIIEPLRTANVPVDMMKRLNERRNSTFSNARVLVICDWITEASKWISVARCFLVTNIALHTVCFLDGVVGTPAATLICEVLAFPIMVLTCNEELIEVREYYKDCRPEEPDPEESGSSVGDPHLQTADGRFYDFQGFGEFIALKSAQDKFEIQTRQGGGEYATVNLALAINTGQDVVAFHCEPKAIYVNDKEVNVGESGTSLAGGASIRKLENTLLYDYRVRTTNGDVIYLSFRATINYWLRLNPNRKGKLFGFLGNFDGNPDNDLQTRDGQPVTKDFKDLYPKFADSWRVKENFLFHYEPGTNTETFTRKDLPKEFRKFTDEELEAAAKVCDQAGVKGEPQRSHCIFDLAVMKDPSLADYYKGISVERPEDEVVESDISYFKNVTITASEQQGTLTDSCLINYRTGEVFQLKDGAAKADKVDAIFSYYCGLDLYPPSNIIYCGGSCGVSRLNNVIVGQKWPIYRTGAADLKLGGDNPYTGTEIPAAEWANIKSSSDLGALSWNGANSVKPDNYQYSSRVGYVSQAAPLGLCQPDRFVNKTLYRFVTKEGKKGVFKLNSMVRTGTGWRVTMDIKIQK